MFSYFMKIEFINKLRKNSFVGFQKNASTPL
jgi:hypothetical protein